MTFFDDITSETELIHDIISPILKMKKSADSGVTVTDIQAKVGTKTDMASTIFKLTERLLSVQRVLKKCGSHMEILNEKAISAGAKVIELQGELLESKNGQIDQFKRLIEEKLPITIKSELKSYSDVVKQNTGDALTIRKITTAVKDAVKGIHKDSERRDNNIIMFGLPEESNENITDIVADDLLSNDQKPQLTEVRFG